MLTFFFNADDLFLAHDLAMVQLEGFPSNDFGLPVQLRLLPLKSENSENSYKIFIEEGRWRQKNHAKNPNQIYFVRRWEIENYNQCFSHYEDCNAENPCINCRNIAAMDDLNQDYANEDYYEQYKDDVMSVLISLFPIVDKKLVIECKQYETKQEEVFFN